MPYKKRYRTKRKSTLSKAQVRQVKSIASKAIDEEIENKSYVIIKENGQLFHNKPLYVDNMLAQIGQGTADGDQGTGASGQRDIRVGDQISLKNINIRFWLSNKNDRPNVMYKAVLFWYPIGTTLVDSFVYNTQTNKMVDRYNRKSISILDTFILTSKENYANTPNFLIPPLNNQGREHSQLATLNKSWKGKKIDYNYNGSIVKGKELGMAVVCYDSFGTLQTDNISSLTYNMLITFQDA